MIQAVGINTGTPSKHSKTNIHLLSFQLLLMIQIKINCSLTWRQILITIWKLNSLAM